MGFDAQFRLTRLPDGRWRADAPGVTIMASTFEEVVERARGPSGAVNGVAATQDALQGGLAAGASTDTPEAPSALETALEAFEGIFVEDRDVFRALASRDSYRAALARGVWWG